MKLSTQFAILLLTGLACAAQPQGFTPTEIELLRAAIQKQSRQELAPARSLSLGSTAKIDPALWPDPPGAERSLAALREAVTVAKPLPPRGYQPVKVVTTKGQTITGLLKNQHNSSYQILGTDEKLHLLLTSEIKSLDFQKKSLMPIPALPAADLDDIIAYLSRQARSRR